MNLANEIPIGASATESILVTRELTVAHLHAGMPEVYGTPMMIYLMEVAAAAAIQEYLPEGWISVGASVEVRHLAPTPVGATVSATAEVTSVRGKLVQFTVRAHDGVETIGEGTHSRVAVQLDQIEARAAQKR